MAAMFFCRVVIGNGGKEGRLHEEYILVVFQLTQREMPGYWHKQGTKEDLAQILQDSRQHSCTITSSPIGSNLLMPESEVVFYNNNLHRDPDIKVWSAENCVGLSQWPCESRRKKTAHTLFPSFIILNHLSCGKQNSNRSFACPQCVSAKLWFSVRCMGGYQHVHMSL